jgi:RimJ/RimL family protein N-acetyltransferase
MPRRARVSTRRPATRAGKARLAALLRPQGFRLRDGRLLRMRPIRESDAEGLRAAFHRLSEESRYQRFMAPVKEVTPDMLERATHLDPSREVALVITHGMDGGELIVGGARFVGDRDHDCCEFAVTLVDDWQGLGLGRRVMRKLLRVAEAMGYRAMYGYVLASNAPMLALMRRLGFRVEDSSEGLRVKLVVRDLGGVS